MWFDDPAQVPWQLQNEAGFSCTLYSAENHMPLSTENEQGKSYGDAKNKTWIGEG
jgi:hypothetical protein